MLRTLILFCFGTALCAQTFHATRDDLLQMMDEMRAAIRREDWPEASRISIRLNAALMLRNRSTSTPSLELQHLIMMAGTDAIRRNPYLPRMAKAAYAAGDYARALGYATEALDGDAIHQGNIVLGRLALRRNDVEEAKRALLAAGKTPGSSNLASTGPSMQLAKDLLDRGETATVVEFLEECKSFWEGDRGKLAEWIALVKAGLKPDFGPNLNY
jgi:hypothetical protein